MSAQDGSPPQAWEISIDGSATVLRCREDVAVLVAVHDQGRHDITIGCRGGGCGVCRVHVDAGEFVRKRSSIRVLPPEDIEQGYALSCRIFPRSDMRLTPHPPP